MQSPRYVDGRGASQYGGGGQCCPQSLVQLLTIVDIAVSGCLAKCIYIIHRIYYPGVNEMNTRKWVTHAKGFLQGAADYGYSN